MAPKAKKEEATKPVKKEEKPAKKDAEANKAEAKKEQDGAKPQKPDEAEYQKRIDAVAAKIQALRGKQDALSEQISKKNTGKEDYESKRQTLYDELAAVKQDREEKMQSLKALKDSEAERRREEKETKSKMSSLEKSLSSEEEIDRSIQEIELKMSTTTMSLKQEKDLMQQIKKLKATRPEVQRKVREYEQMKAKCESSVQNSGLSVKEQIDQLQKEFSEKSEKHSEIYKKITELKAKRTEEMGDVTSLIEKKQSLKAEIMALQDERNNIYTEKKEMMKAFNEWDKKQRLSRQKEMQAKWEAEQAERAASNAAWELEKPNPYLNETTLLEQTIDYCKQLLGEDKKTDEDKAETNKPEEWTAPVQGAQVMMAKKDRDTEFYFAPTKGKKGLKGKKESAEPKSAKIKHTAATFKIFEDLKLPAPINTTDVPPLLEKLEKSLAQYNEKVKTWEQDRRKKIEDAKNKTLEVAAEAAA